MPAHSSSRQASLSEHDRLLPSEDFNDVAADLLAFESSSGSEYDDVDIDGEAERALDHHRIPWILQQNQMPPSPQLDSRQEYQSWPDQDAPSKPALRLPFSWNPEWFLSSGNVFWGFHRQRRRPASRYGTLNYSLSWPSPAHFAQQRDTSRPLRPVGFRSQGMLRPAQSQDSLQQARPLSPALSRPRAALEHAFRPTSKVIDDLLNHGPRRVLVLTWIPVLLVLCWCGVPFPAHENEPMKNDAAFWFFLVWYFGIYVAVALVFITQLFTLYRLNWWPRAIGARVSYAFFWVMSLFCGYIIHKCTPSRPQDDPSSIARPDNQEWQLKTEWVLLTFATMSMPALVCLMGLRRSGRQHYRPAMTDVQKPFASIAETAWRIPSSYRRFLWFMCSLGLSLVTLLAGQVYTIVFMRTLPHSGADGTLYVAFWMLTVHILSALVQWIMSEKVRSRALLFAFKFYYFLVYFIFYRNLFARLRSFDQFALVQLLSSTWVCLWYPFCMSQTWLRTLNLSSSRPISHDMHVKKISLYFYLRTVAQHTTMLAFLGWLSLLHFGINQPLYPFFAFDDDDSYNYRLTIIGSLAIWASEMASNFLTTLVRMLTLTASCAALCIVCIWQI